MVINLLYIYFLLINAKMFISFLHGLYINLILVYIYLIASNYNVLIIYLSTFLYYVLLKIIKNMK